MPSAATPTVSPGPSLVLGSLQRLAGLPAALRRMGRKRGDAWFRKPSPDASEVGAKATRLQRDELGAMSAHELSDLSIGRSEIPALTGEPAAWRSSRFCAGPARP